MAKLQNNQTVSQQTLFGDKKILDSTCSYSKIWPKHATVRIDIRKEVNPDIVMDAKDLKFPDNYFDEIYCDPPHLYSKKEPLDLRRKRRLTGRTSPNMWQRYGFWKSKDEWFEFLDKTNIEFFRCLKPNGLLFYKTTEASSCANPQDVIDKMTNFKLIDDKIVGTKANTGKGLVHWMTLRRNGNK